MLIEAYNKMKAEGKALEIVFVSSDRSPKEFEGYFAGMPWLAIPFDSDDKEELEAKLSSKYGVQGIPTLVLLNEKGKTITKVRNIIIKKVLSVERGRKGIRF